jgi:ATP-dependent Lon protease
MRVSLEAALPALPLFPLPQVVLFPRALLPLHVFEPRYQKMLADCMETHGALAVVLITSSLNENVKIASIAGAGIVLEHQPMPGGRSNIIVSGQARVRLEELPFEPPYRRAKATILEDVPTSVAPADLTALAHAATSFVSEVKKRDPSFGFHWPPNLAPGALADLCTHHLVIDIEVRQKVLEELDVRNRVQLVTRELASQNAALSGPRNKTLN